ncbi:MAG: beta-propeller fold lactonase family protein, partial [Planctomycetes bacterium]|nr:beta-propeller fold lactonase family protein [Planctomycetota bacterium]
FVSGGVDDVVYVFDAANGFAAAATIAVGDPNQLDLVAGMCSDTEGRLWVCLQRTHRLLRLAADGTVELDLALAPDSFPFECALSGDGARLFVSLWGRAQLACFDARTGAALGAVDVGAHPSALLMHPDGRRLFVSHANENTVGVIDVAALRVTETLSSALYPLAPPGSTPNALALDPSGELLFVANADNNDLAVIEVEAPGRARSLGFIPVGQYPTAVHVTADGRVVVANGKGSRGSAPNPRGPQPEVGHVRDVDHYSGALFRGSLSVFPLPELDPAGAAQLRELTRLAYACSPLQADGGVAPGLRPADSPIPAAPGGPTPITHCVYIIKENRTYDHVLGDDPRGNGDPTLCIFPEVVTPNHHALARDFVLLDSFYTEAEVSADGHEWSMGAYASDVVERTWPVTY